MDLARVFLLHLIVRLVVAGRFTQGHFVVEKSSIKVITPPGLRSRHDAAIGNFGVPQYGGSMLGSLVYPGKDSFGCEPFDGDKPFKSKSFHPNILLLDRGGCYFVLKVWNGQQAGAAAVIVADNVDEPLITMDSPEESSDADGYIEKIEVPSALIDHSLGKSVKQALQKGDEVLVKLDWRESIPYPDDRVEYELWISSNDECGTRCEDQMDFINNFRGHAQVLEKGGYTLFTPHYITWYCPEAFKLSNQCKSQCINRGRYCAPDPEKDFGVGYEGKDVVFENLRQLCVHRVANESNRSWVWWDYITDFQIRCSMKKKKYSKDCAKDVIRSLDLRLDEIKQCMGDPEADVENQLLKTEQELQVGRGSRGDVTILPTLVINDVQYRGKLERTGVLKAICAGFKETTDPPVCLSPEVETNECLTQNGGCWPDALSNVSACRDTFRGRVCECPLIGGVQYRGDGYTYCEPFGPGRCSLNNGGCWSDTREGKTFSACKDSQLSGCSCPPGFKGDGHQCEDIDECMEGSACQCESCSCKNTWGGYDCKCPGNLIYLANHDTCIVRQGIIYLCNMSLERNGSRLGWFITFMVLAAVGGLFVAGYIFYKYRLRSYMDSEIMAIMSQYMPLDNHQNNQVHSEGQPLRGGSIV